MNISADELKTEELRLRYLDLIRRPEVFPTRANWQFISSHAMRGLGHELYRKYLGALTIDDNDRQPLHDTAIEEFPKYLAAISRAEAVEVIYSDVTTATEATLELIREQSLFDAPSLTRLIQDGHLREAMAVLDVYQPEYTEADLGPMRRLLQTLDTLPELGSVEQVSGLFGSSLKYICPAGHRNSPDDRYCRHEGCGLDICGLTAADTARIGLFRSRLTALTDLLSHPFKNQSPQAD